MAASLLLSRVLGIVREMIISWQFGQNSFTDAYRNAFTIPDLLFFLIAGGALSSAFIPVFSEYLHTDREEDAWKVFSAVATIMSVLVLAFIVVCWVLALPIVHAMLPKLAPDQVELVATMSRIVLPAQFAFFIGGLMMGTLYSRQVFAIPGLGPNIYNVGIIFGALVISHFVVPGVMGMTWGALIGAFLGNLIIPILVMRKMGSRFSISFDTTHPGVRKVFRLMAPVIFGLSLPAVFPLIMRTVANLYPVKGLPSSIELANQMMQAPLGVFGQSLALAAFPALAQFVAQNRMDMYRDQVSSTLRTVLYLSVPVSVLLVVMPTPIIRAAFEHGKFTAEATERTAACLAMFAVGVWAWCLQPVLMRSYFALHQTVIPIVMGTIVTGIFALGCYGVYKFDLPFTYLPLVGSLSATTLVIALLVGVHRISGGLDLVGIGRTLGKAAISAIGAGILLWLATMLMPTGTHAGARLAQIGLTGFLMVSFAWVYYFATRALKMPESSTIDRALKKISRRKH